jgi:hypothetical protein
VTDNERWDIQMEEHAKCVKHIEEFAELYVEKWIETQGDAAKAEGWAILQAAASLRKYKPELP